MPRISARAMAVILFLSAPVALAEGQGAPEGVAPEAALKMLKDGNQCYATNAVNPRHYRAERPKLTTGQKPYAIVLSCADSRVPPEIVFDESLGRLFVIRVAGNFAGPDEIASIEYAAEAVKENVRLQLKNVTARSELLKKMMAEGHFGTAGAVYDLASGKVEWLAP